MDIQSILGYSRNSPFRGNPYIDIQSNIIDMSNTDFDLLGIDNLGNKKKMKAGRKKPYKFAGSSVREIPMQAGGVYTQAELDAENARITRLLTAQGATPYDIANTRVKGTVGSPKIPIIGSPLQDTTPLATTLPFGVTQEQVQLTNEGYGYFHPQKGTFVKVNPSSVFPATATKSLPANTMTMSSVAKAFEKGGRNPYLQKGGYSPMDLYRYLFSDDESEYDSSDKEESPHTAPSEEELGIDDVQQPPEPDDYEVALQMALAEDNYQTVAGNPMIGSNQSFFTPKVVGVNPYTSSTPQANIGNPSKYAYEFFQKKGLPAHVSAGIVGNLIQESGNFRPDVITDEITGDNGMSHGIAQWQKDRWPAMKKWAASQGKDPLSLDTQLEYVYVEANQRGDLQKTLLAKTPEEAANIFAKHYERPAFIDKNRARNARELYQQ